MNFTCLFARAGLLLVLLAGCLLLARPASAADAVVGDGTPESCTEDEFDAALAQVSIHVTGIVFDCGGPATIIFDSQKVINAQLLDIDGGGEITLSGGNSTRLFYIQSAAGTVVFSNITLTNGFSGAGYGGAIFAEQGTAVLIRNSTIRNSKTGEGFAGGAICSFATNDNAVTIRDSTIVNNESTYGAVNTVGATAVSDSVIRDNIGGGLIVGGATEIVDSSFSSNSGDLGGAIRVVAGTTEMTRGGLQNNSARSGGAVYNRGNLLLTDVDVFANSADAFGGAIFNGPEGYIYLDGVTVHGNEIDDRDGAALYNLGQLAAFNSTFSRNFAGALGYEMENEGTLTFTDSTIIGARESGFTIWNFDRPGIVLRFKNTIVLGSGIAGTACVGKPATSSDFSLYQNNTCPWTSGDGNIITSSPWIVNHLADNGGPTLTHMIFSNGPAFDAGQCNPGVDQRGLPRPQGAACDIGSVEWHPIVYLLEYLYLPMQMK